MIVILGSRHDPAACWLAETLPDVQTITLPGCGHSMMAEEPDAVLDALVAFLTRCAT